MDEKNQNEQNSTQNELKQETVNTFNEAKEQMKNIDFKKEAEVGKGLMKKLFNDPVGAVKDIVNDEKNSFFKTALLLVGIWLVVILVYEIIYHLKYNYIKFDVLETIKDLLGPVLGIIALTVIVFLMSNKNKKSFITIITTMSIAKLPLIATAILGFLRLIDANAGKIVSPISALFTVISVVISYFAVKFLSGEDDDKEALKKFVIVEAIYYLVAFVISFLGISI